MRLAILSSSILAMSAAMLAAPAMAQSTQSSEPSVAGYLCQFADKCGDTATADQQVTKDAPATKGFRLARPNQDAKPAQAAGPTEAAPKTKGFRIARPTAAAATRPAEPAKHYVAPTRSAPAAERASAARPHAASRGSDAIPNRADLMVEFQLGSEQLTDRGIAKAHVFAQSLMMPEMAGKRFLIEGHTDSSGTRDNNIDLSRRRAQSVVDYLVSQGVDRARLEIKGVGPDDPLPGRKASDPDNRRVEAELIS